MANTWLLKRALQTVVPYMVICLTLAASQFTGTTPPSTAAPPKYNNLCESVTGGSGMCVQGSACSPGYTQMASPLGPYFLVCSSGSVCCVQDTAPAPAPDNNTCGVGNPPMQRVLNGQDASPCEFPFAVSIRARTIGSTNEALDLSSTQPVCGGVLVGEGWVLTHPICCYSGRGRDNVSLDLVVVAGEYDVTSPDLDPVSGLQTDQVVGVSECIINPDFEAPDSIDQFRFDNFALMNGNATALLRLAEPVRSSCASQACLPSFVSSGQDANGPVEQCVFLGWGISDLQSFATSNTPKKGMVKIYKDEVCDYLTRVLAPFLPRPDGSACQVSSAETEVCVGDHGGPVMCYDGAQWSVQAILPLNFCESGIPNPFVIDVSRFEPWIRATIGL
ncbi:hypothetical protein BaRGS_00003146 [Batillaria attramentaria]|uniref:Peptidase S1 domain-containing protein n=1 Tax=Batillaria attramentaria TaxID=370345 RepID=A0ABD0M2S1_9CAEN